MCSSGISVGPWPWGQLQLFESERSLLFPPFFLLFFRSILSFYVPPMIVQMRPKTSKKAAERPPKNETTFVIHDFYLAFAII